MDGWTDGWTDRNVEIDGRQTDVGMNGKMEN